ncbi:MAG: hypothetical protein RLZZ546_423, partial [Bacteroidota bacterium]
TDGKNGGVYTADELALKIVDLFPKGKEIFVVCTGGEPALQVDENLIHIFHRYHIEIAIETNGTKILPQGIDWICVSPKENTDIVIKKGNELKLVFPQVGNHPSQFDDLDFEHFYLQPCDDLHKQDNVASCVDYCLKHPHWKLSLQTHKILGID